MPGRAGTAVHLHLFGDSTLDTQFSVWARRENFLALRNRITAEIKRGFDQAGIEIPFPHGSLYTGEVTKPFPITLVRRRDGSPTHRPSGDTTDGSGPPLGS